MCDVLAPDLGDAEGRAALDCQKLEDLVEIVGGRGTNLHGGNGTLRTRPPSSSGLGLRPFTPAARVRIPLGVCSAVVEPTNGADVHVVQELRLVRGSLSQSEARVVDTILEDPYAFLNLSTSEVAARAARACVHAARWLAGTRARRARSGSYLPGRPASPGVSAARAVADGDAEPLAASSTRAFRAGPTFTLVQDFVNHATVWDCRASVGPTR